MVLLKQELKAVKEGYNLPFTFQYGSIKTSAKEDKKLDKKNLHSSMVLLKQSLLLLLFLPDNQFTFQYGSIKT